MSDVKSLGAALHARLAGHFGNRLATVDFYLPEQGGTVNTPAALIDLESFDQGDDDGTERLPVLVHGAVHCLLGFRTPNVQTEVRAFALEVMRVIRQPLPGLGRVERLSAVPGAFKPGKDGYEDFVVTFDLECKFGESVWDDSTVIPQQVFVGHVPRVGIPHEPDYERVSDPPEVTP